MHGVTAPRTHEEHPASPAAAGSLPRKGDRVGYRYRPPTPELRQRYRDIFASSEPLPMRRAVTFVDRAISILALVLSAPLWPVLVIANAVEGWLHPHHRGPLFAPYISASRGRKFLKYKLRVMAVAGVPRRLLRRCDYRFYPSENEPGNLTCAGRLLKKFYLDELPQAWNIFRGEMSMVGPRALAWHHYQLGLGEGHVIRRRMLAGIFSETHVRKSSPDFPDSTYEYDYAERYVGMTTLALLGYNLRTVLRGIFMVAEGRGL
jgi:lipopolysaccharide/colanic/teichoic acid biosynthesis glycosyltransferase